MSGDVGFSLLQYDYATRATDAGCRSAGGIRTSRMGSRSRSPRNGTKAEIDGLAAEGSCEPTRSREGSCDAITVPRYGPVAGGLRGYSQTSTISSLFTFRNILNAVMPPGVRGNQQKPGLGG